MTPEEVEAAELQEALDAVGLGHLKDRLDDDAAWDRILSGGEQQRVAFVRLFLHKPDIAVMDEATSALDTESQGKLMDTLIARLPRTAIISVGHRPELEAFHERKFSLVRREGGARLTVGEIVAPPLSVLAMLLKRWRGPRPPGTPPELESPANPA
jgi:putative ATP-binding cassette transporter